MLNNINIPFTAEQILWLSGVVTVIITSIIQALSKKYKPWSWLANQLGKAINKEMIDKIDKIEKKVDNLELRDTEQDKKSDEEKARAARRRILRCSDEIRRKDRHSEEYFNDVLDDISFYKRYCNEHPNFENEKAVIAIRLVEQTYEYCINENDFL